MTIEEYIIDYLATALATTVGSTTIPFPVSGDVPSPVPDRFVTVEQTGADAENKIRFATIAVQSWHTSRAKAAELNARTHEKLAHEEEKILHRLHEEIAELAVLAAGQILQREVKETDYTELVDRVIEEAKTAKWENQ